MGSTMNEALGTASTVPTIEIVVNGKAATVPAASTVHDFLASKRMTDAMAIVERNGTIVPRAEYATTEVRAGDRLEVVHAVGGG
jgi:sulfur carrier protein